MKIWRIVVLGLLGLAGAGCQNDPTIAMLERDNRKKEWEIIQLRGRVQDLEEAVAAGEPARRALPPGEMPPEPGTIEGRASTRPGRPVSGASPADTLPEPGVLNLSPGIEAAPGEIPDRLKVPGGNSLPRNALPGGSAPAGPSLPPSSRWTPVHEQPLARNSGAADNGAVGQLTLHPALTGGIGSSDYAGDEGLLVVVEPRDFGGNIVAAPGDLSVALIDPALSGQQARLGRWDFSAAQTEGMIHAGPEPGIHLHLPWTSTPVHDRLKVVVRYTTRDGRKLQADRLIAVALNAPRSVPQEVIRDAEPVQTATRPQWSPER